MTDLEGYPLGDISAAREKTERMETFLQSVLKFDSVRTLTNLDLDGVATLFDQIEKEEVSKWEEAQ